MGVYVAGAAAILLILGYLVPGHLAMLRAKGARRTARVLVVAAWLATASVPIVFGVADLPPWLGGVCIAGLSAIALPNDLGMRLGGGLADGPGALVTYQQIADEVMFIYEPPDLEKAARLRRELERYRSPDTATFIDLVEAELDDWLAGFKDDRDLAKERRDRLLAERNRLLAAWRADAGQPADPQAR